MTERRLPTGTVTFLFSDIDGSTRLVQDLGPAVFTDVLERHNSILRESFARHGGTERGTQGDLFLVMFPEAPAAIAAAADVQRGLARESWPAGASVAVRIGVHTGIGRLGGDDYVGIDVNRAARVAAAAHGGQVLVSNATRALADSGLPAGVHLQSLGEHRLKDLARPEHLHQLVIDGLPSDFPPVRSLRSVPGNLPARLTSFIGRERELEELASLLADSRLLTLTGTGGTGKTSLAIELARNEASRFHDGAWLVPLEAIADPALVADTIATTIGLTDLGGESLGDRLKGYLADRSILLVLDNFEHLLAAAPLVGELLKAAPGATIVATSRAPLRVVAEQEFPVAPLPLPDVGVDAADVADNDAIRLFVARAARIRPGFRLTPEDAPAVVEICRRLDGLPLGIELAASRVALMPPRALADRLRSRLDLPGTGARDLPARQRTLQATIAWSHDLLADPEQRLLARLSVFVGGCRLEEAEAVCGPEADLGVDVVDGISALVDQGLVQPVQGPDLVRFRLLGTVRMFAAERLTEAGASAELRRRHALAYLSMAEAAAAHLPGRHQVRLLDQLAADHDNIRAAVDWAIETQDPEIALRFGAALWRFWAINGHLEEGRASILRILAVPGADLPTIWRAGALDAAGGVRWWSADLEGANRYYTEQVALARRLGDERALANALFNLSHPTVVTEPGASDLLMAEALGLYRRLGDERSIARAEWMPVSRELRRDPAASREALEALLERFESFDDDFYAAMAVASLAWASIASGDLDGRSSAWAQLPRALARDAGHPVHDHRAPPARRLAVPARDAARGRDRRRRLRDPLPPLRRPTAGDVRRGGLAVLGSAGGHGPPRDRRVRTGQSIGRVDDARRERRLHHPDPRGPVRRGPAVR